MPEHVFWEQYVHFPGAMNNLLQVLVGRMIKNNEAIVSTAQQRLEYEHLQRELETAGKIQLGILPKGDPLFPNHPQVDVHAIIDPATEVGGDFFDAFALDEERVYVAIGDVSGKGMPAALFMMQCVSLLRMSMFNEMQIDKVIPQINRVLTDSNDGQLFLTLFGAVIHTKTGEMTYMNGGHNPPFISRKDGDFDMIEMPAGTLMGLFSSARFEVGRTVLSPGDTVVIYTDGVTEAESVSGDFYGEELALQLLNENKDQGVHVQVERLKHDVLKFAAGRPPSDDMTILAVRFIGE
jgi:sigma-B regulation protein RsbU (phosphoserine phosphatase)